MDARSLVKRFVPPRVRIAVRRALRQPVVPPPHQVRFGDFRRTTPIASDFGYSRGGPVDRYYIESFLERHRDDVRGRVLEVGDAAYTRRFGEAKVARSEVLHVDPVPGVTFVGDLADETLLPAEAFDCVILTQTLHLVYDFHAALRSLSSAIAPAGVLLMTVPGISNVDAGEWGSTWYYSFTEHSVRRMCRESFPGWDLEIESHGNVLAATAFLHGLAQDELDTAELDVARPEYGIVHTARVVKPARDR